MPTKLIYGEGTVNQLADIVSGYGYNKIFVVTGPNIGKSESMKKVKKAFEEDGIEYEVYSKLNNEPSVKQIDAGADILKKSEADVVVAVGGGSRIDAAKAMCVLQTHEGSIADYLFGGTKKVVRPIMPLICIPTTAGSGSEVTAVSVLNDEDRGVKVSVTHEFLYPKLAIIDPEMHVGMPASISASTGMDALTHAIESYVSLNSEPISDAFGLQAIKMISENIRKVIANPEDIEARANMAIASSMAGVAFANGGLGVVHGIAQAMGAVAGVSHGVANSLILPYAMRKNLSGNYLKFKQIAVAMGENVINDTVEGAAQKSADAVFRLAKDVKIPMKLSEVGISKDMFPAIIEGTMAYRLLAINPKKLDERDIEEILNEAY